MKIQEIDFSLNLLQALLWQYNTAPNIQSLSDSKQLWYDVYQTSFWAAWYNDVFNLVTAEAFGLAVWSIILDLPLYIQLNPDEPDKPVFGFNEDPQINDYVNFENGNFTNQNSSITLTIEEQRLILRLRYYQLVSRGAIPDTNQFLSVLFNTSGTVYNGQVWELDGFDMTIVYVFNFLLPYQMRYILNYFDLLPRPAGVKIRYVILTGSIFGFGPYYQNFENGNFVPEFL